MKKKNDALAKEANGKNKQNKAKKEKANKVPLRERLHSRRFQHGTLATLLTLAAVVIAVLVCSVTSVLADRFSLAVDLTEDKAFQLGDQSLQILENLDQDVNIYFLTAESTLVNSGGYLSQLASMLSDYDQRSDRVSVSYIDLERNPSFVQQFSDLTLTDGDLLVESGGQTSQYTLYDLFNFDSYGSVISSKVEQQITSAIFKLTSEDTPTISVVSGHGELEAPGYTDRLSASGYNIVEQNLLTEDINSEADIVLIVAPSRDYDEDSLRKLDDFLAQDGKSVLYFASREQTDTPYLDAFLQEWGIEVGDGIVLETDSTRVYRTYSFLAPIPIYGDEVYAAPYMNQNLYTALPSSRPVSVLFESSDDIVTSTLLAFSETSNVVPADADESYELTAGGEAIGAMVLSTRTDGDVTSNVVACGSVYAIADSMLENTALANGDFFVNVCDELTQRETTVNISSVSLNGEELGITYQTAITAGVLFAVVIPVVVLGAGMAVYLRRRHR